MTRRTLVAVVATWVAVIVLPTTARAQSAIAGVVRDASGGVLPGVTVEASSDVLIEKTRTVVTDGEGQYKVIDLRPGVYSVTFSLVGFQTVKREGVELPSEFTATISAEMKVGSVSETITVTAPSPVVDVQSAAHIQVIDRDAIDNLPTGRTIQGIGQLVVGVSLSLPDVGGSRAAMQTYMSVHGLSAAQNSILVDGLVVTGLEANGQVQNYFNDAASQEMSYQTSGISAETSTGGVRLNMISKEGGNKFSGAANFSYRPGEWQGDNLTQRLQTSGLTVGNSTQYISDLAGSEGGPLKKDRIWFFGAVRDYRTSNRVSNTFFDDGTQGDDYNYIRQAEGHLTFQLSARHKISAHYDRISKYRAHDMQSLYDPETASLVWGSPNYSNGYVKWTSPLTNKLLLESGYSFNVENRTTDMQPGVEFDRGTPGWFAGAARTQAGTTLGAYSVSPPSAGSQYPDRYNYMAAASYVTGSHRIKGGFQLSWGPFFHEVRANADLYEEFTNVDTSVYTKSGGPIVFSSPVSVVVRNTPVLSQESLGADLGIFAQDSWTMKRMTINAGLRWEYLNSRVDALTAPAGRFVPARTAPEVRDLPKWKDIAPRFQAVYDVFGNGKTAIKYSLNRYNQAQTTTIAAGLNPLASRTARVNWTDLNGDGVAQGQRTWNDAGTSYTDCTYLTPGCEINLSQLASNFGLLSDAGTYNGAPRTWYLENGVEVQHELMPKLSISGAWFRGDFRNLTTTVNTAITPADYTPVQIFNPIDGSPLTIYNISAAAQARATNNVVFSDPDRKDVFNSFGFEFRARPGRGVLIFGGMSFERELTDSGGVSGTTTTQTSTNNCTVGRLQDPNVGIFCDMTNAPSDKAVPWARNFKMSASYPLPWGVSISASFQSVDGGARPFTYNITRTTRYPDGSATYLGAGVPVATCPSPCSPGALVFPTLTAASLTIPLYPDSTNRYERLNQLDLKLTKTFRCGGISILPNLEIFNINNSDKVITVTSNNYATAGGSFLRPNSIVQGRIIGVGAQVRW